MDKKKKSQTGIGNLVIKTTKKGKSFLIDEGMYKVKLENIEISKGQFGEQIQWDFKIIKGKNKSKMLRDWSPVGADAKNKTGKYIKAIGRIKKISEGDFDLESLIGKKCKVLVGHADTKDGGVRNKIETVFRLDLED